MNKDEYIRQQDAALAGVAAVGKRLEAGTISASEAENEMAALMVKAERDSALHAEAMRTAHAASRHRLLVLAVLTALGICAWAGLRLVA
ncbi:MAG: hypothetical protein WC617_18605 [Rhodanobacter sp.]|jgi:hypothetical protein